MTKKTKSKLNHRQLLFCKEYLKDFNATNAMSRAGYKGKNPHITAVGMMKKPHVREYIQKEMDKRAKRVEIDADFVLNGIKEAIQDAKRDGNHSSVLKGFELLGKHLKLFTDVQEHKIEFTSMGEVKVTAIDSNAKTIEHEPLMIDIGSEPNKIQ